MAAVLPQRGQKTSRTWGADMLVAVAHDPLIHQRTGSVRRSGIGRNSLSMQESVNRLDVVGKVHAIVEAPPPQVLTRVELYTLCGARSGLDFLRPADMLDGAADASVVGEKRGRDRMAGFAAKPAVPDASFGQTRRTKSDCGGRRRAAICCSP